MRYAIIVLVLAGVLALPRPAAALTGNDLLERCTDQRDLMKVWCGAYLDGWFDRHRIIVKGRVPGWTRVCFPTEGAGVRRSQLIDVLVRYLKNHPEVRHKSSHLFTWTAFEEAWPCSKN